MFLYEKFPKLIDCNVWDIFEGSSLSVFDVLKIKFNSIAERWAALVKVYIYETIKLYFDNPIIIAKNIHLLHLYFFIIQFYLVIINVHHG